MKLTPINVHISLDYECPKCELEFDLSYKTVKNIKKAYCPYCETSLSFGPISLPDIGFETKVSKVKNEDTKQQNKTLDISKNEETCSTALCNLGYKKQDANKITKSFLKDYQGSNADQELIESLLNYVNTPN